MLVYSGRSGAPFCQVFGSKTVQKLICDKWKTIRKGLLKSKSRRTKKETAYIESLDRNKTIIQNMQEDVWSLNK